MEYIAVCPSPVGELTLASDGKSLTGLWIKGQKYFGATLDTEHRIARLAVFDYTKDWLARYFNGEAPTFTYPLAPRGSAFRQQVWEVLRSIPYGIVTTYGAIARRIAGRSNTAAIPAQAVGGAVGHNPVSIIIPCHRVVGSNGSLTGYAGGIDVKLRLLTLEKADITKLFVPLKNDR